MNNLIPFDSGNVPSAISAIFGDPSANDMVGNAGGLGFPVISIKGKVFHIVRGGERTLITKPGEDDPASSLEVVVLRANPDNSKVYYASGYQEGSDSKPTCYSNSGKAPEANAEEPQAKTCAACAHNQWGSRITPDGKKGKSCSDSRRIAIATPDAPNDPMLVRVPAASLKAMVEYGKILASRGVKPQAVITKIGFDYSVAHPALTFKPVAFIGDTDQLTEIKKSSESELVAQIVGLQAVPASDAPAEEAEALPAPTPTPTPTPTPAAKQTEAPKANKPAAKVAKPATVAASQAAEATPQSPSATLESQISTMIDGMDFDD
jgi:hypothetical protein